MEMASQTARKTKLSTYLFSIHVIRSEWSKIKKSNTNNHSTLILHKHLTWDNFHNYRWNLISKYLFLFGFVFGYISNICIWICFWLMTVGKVLGDWGRPPVTASLPASMTPCYAPPKSLQFFLGGGFLTAILKLNLMLYSLARSSKNCKQKPKKSIKKQVAPESGYSQLFLIFHQVVSHEHKTIKYASFLIVNSEQNLN